MFKKALAGGAIAGLGIAGFLGATPASAQTTTPSESCVAAEAFGADSGGTFQVAVNGEAKGSSLAKAGIDGGDRVTVTYTIGAACAGTPVGLASYKNPAPTFERDVTQTLADARMGKRVSGTLTVRVPDPTDGRHGWHGRASDHNQCGCGHHKHGSCDFKGWQVDFFVGKLLWTVGPNSGYYDTAPNHLIAGATS